MGDIEKYFIGVNLQRLNFQKRCLYSKNQTKIYFIINYNMMNLQVDKT